jgi:signal transduction histidine kinase
MDIRKPILALLFVMMLASPGFAQSKYTDSLNVELARAKDDTSRVLILADLGYYHRYQNLDTAMAYGQQALSLAQTIKFLRGESIAYQIIGVIYRLRGDLSKALELEFKALKIAEENNFESEKAFSFLRVALVYLDLNEIDKAIAMSRKSLQIFGSEKRIRVNAINYLQLGNYFERVNQLDSAWYYEKKAYDQLDLIRDLTSDVYRSLGNIQLKKENRPLALRFYKEAIDYAKNQNDYRAISLAYAQMAILHRKENNLDSSFYYAKKGLEYAQKSSNRRGILTCGNLLAEMYESTNPAEALRYYKIATEAKEGLFGAGNLQAIQALVVKEEERKQEIELAEAAYRAQLKQYALLASLGVFLIVALLLYRNNLNRKKANELLHKQKDEIEMQKVTVEQALTNLKSTQAQLIQKEKLASLGELTAGIAHEIQNPLNFVNNFSELSIDLAQELKEEIEKRDIDKELVSDLVGDLVQNQAKINLHGKRASNIVKGMLEHSRTSTGERALTDINQLADEYLRLSYHGMRAKDKSGSTIRFNADYKTDFDESLPKINIIPQDIGRVLLNLINNAFYAAYQSKKPNPMITVSTEQIPSSEGVRLESAAGGWVKITVKDNGNGIPDAIKAKIFQPFFTTKPTGEGTGLGLSLAYDIVTKGHGGTLEVVSTEGEGAEFMVTLPCEK